MDLLLKAGIAEIKDSDGNSLMHHAAEFCESEMIDYCLNKGLSCNEENNFGDTAIDLAVENSHYRQADLMREMYSRLRIYINMYIILKHFCYGLSSCKSEEIGIFFSFKSLSQIHQLN